MDVDLNKWVSDYLDIVADDAQKDQVFIWVKKLRVSNEAMPIVFEDGRQGQAQNGWEKGIVAKMEFYLKRDSFFYPLYRYDSTLIVDQVLPEDAGIFITEVFKDALAKLYNINFDAVAYRAKKLTLNDIATFNKRNNNHPILNETEFKKGAYVNFDEFK
ncbi:MAG: hypothetical protein WCG67_07330, partial [Ferruginibacter sp.]